MPWDTFENMCFFALIRIVFRNNNFPLRMSTYVSFTFIHWIVFACTFCCVAMENVEHVDARFLWNVQMPSETKIAKNQCPWLAFTKPFHPMHCFYSICIVASHQKEFKSKPFSTFFFSVVMLFFSGASKNVRTNSLLVLFRLVMDCDVILLSGVWTHTFKFSFYLQMKSVPHKIFHIECAVHATA